MSDEWRSDDLEGHESDEFSEQNEDLETELGNLARQLSRKDVYLVDPPADLWDAIAAEVANTTPAVAPEQPIETTSARSVTELAPAHPVAGSATERPVTESVTAHPVAGSATEQPVTESVTARPVTELATARPQSGRRGPLLALAAAVGLLIVAGAFVLGQRGESKQVVAQARITNDGLPVAFAESGRAEVLRNGEDLYLALDLPDLPPTASGDAYYEVWMIDADVDGMVSLGVVTPDGRVDLPDDLDPAAFPVVDISVEPLDGDPTHSGQSILRGVLAEPGQT